MKAMILAVQVIEMVQGSAARPHSKASREGDLCGPVHPFGHRCPLHDASPITAHQSPFPTQSAERLQKQKEIERPKRTWSLMLMTAMAMTMSRPPSPIVRVKRLALPR